MLGIYTGVKMFFFFVRVYRVKFAARRKRQEHNNKAFTLNRRYFIVWP